MAFHFNGYSNFHEMNLDWIISKIPEIFKISEEVKADAESAAETAEYINELLTKNIFSPDNYDGTDTQKLQACLNELAETGGTICLNRSYNIESDLVCSLNTNDNIRIAIIGLSADSQINMNGNSFVGTMDDLTGGLWFYNVYFQGSGTLFKCAKLIRLKFVQCFFKNFNKIFEDGSDNTNQILQSIYLDQCTIRNIVNSVFYVNHNAVYDIHVSGCLMEAGGSFFTSYGNDFIAGLYVTNNCLEGIEHVFKSSANQSVMQCVFENNYFEKNNKYFDMTQCRYVGNMAIRNNFVAENLQKPFIQLPTSISGSNPLVGALTVENNILADNTSPAYLFALPVNPVKGAFTGVEIKNNRFAHLTVNNNDNSYLPYKNYGKLQLEYSGTDLNEFVTNMASDIVDNMTITTDVFNVKWTGNTTFLVLFCKTGSAAANVFFTNGLITETFRYVSGTVSNLAELAYKNDLASYMPMDTASDPDQVKTTGVYTIGTGLYIVMRLDSNFIAQIRIRYNTDYIEYRSCISGTWQSWYRLTGVAQP